MKFEKFEHLCYRAHNPKWSFVPDSGDGAATRGGRFNRPGQPALYLSLAPGTALIEANQGFRARLHPLTLCEYDVACENILDLRTPAALRKLEIAQPEIACSWQLHLLDGREPPSWLVVDRLKADGAAGILVHSLAPGAGARDNNLVLWKWAREAPHKVVAFDPEGRLPKDQSSWNPDA